MRYRQGRERKGERAAWCARCLHFPFEVGSSTQCLHLLCVPPSSLPQPLLPTTPPPHPRVHIAEEETWQSKKQKKAADPWAAAGAAKTQRVLNYWCFSPGKSQLSFA